MFAAFERWPPDRRERYYRLGQITLGEALANPSLVTLRGRRIPRDGESRQALDQSALNRQLWDA